uniref:Uncharacterized protein n=1 Tax=Plectus sambesii TaxID=2011161 RepID=A0A914WSM7_9BILA
MMQAKVRKRKKGQGTQRRDRRVWPPDHSDDETQPGGRPDQLCHVRRGLLAGGGQRRDDVCRRTARPESATESCRSPTLPSAAAALRSARTMRRRRLLPPPPPPPSATTTCAPPPPCTTTTSQSLATSAMVGARSHGLRNDGLRQPTNIK